MGHKVTFSFLLLLGRCALNFGMAVYVIVLAGAYDIGTVLGDGEAWHILGDNVLGNNLEICSTRRMHGVNQTGRYGERCLVTAGLPATGWRVLMLGEGVITLSIMFSAIAHAAHLVIWPTGHGRISAANGHFLSLVLPRIGSKFSLLMFLHLADVTRLANIISRGDIRCIGKVCRSSIIRTANEVMREGHDGIYAGIQKSKEKASQVKEEASKVKERVHNAVHQHHGHPYESHADDMETAVKQDSDYSQDQDLTTLEEESNSSDAELMTGLDKSGKAMTYAFNIFCVVMCVVFIIACFHVLLMKLTMVHFASLYSPYVDWHWREYVTFLGFINQLGGLSLASEVEMLRVLLFKFGGESSKWGKEQINACDTYLQLLAYETVHQLGRARALMVMWTLNAQQFQLLFQSARRARELERNRETAKEMYHCLNNKTHLLKLRTRLLDKFLSTSDSWQDKLIYDSEDENVRKFNRMWEKAIGELHMIASVQEFICVWDEEDVRKGLVPAKADQETKQSPTAVDPEHVDVVLGKTSI